MLGIFCRTGFILRSSVCSNVLISTCSLSCTLLFGAVKAGGTSTVWLWYCSFKVYKINEYIANEFDFKLVCAILFSVTSTCITL